MSDTTVTYRTRRREIAQFYRFLWLHSPRLRRGQIVTGGAVLVVSLAVSAAGGRRGGAALLVGLAWAAIAVAFLWLYPVLRFRSQERSLSIDEEGIRTAVGSRTARIPWGDVDIVAARGDRVYIVRRNGTGFVVPLRAFGSAEALAAFAREVGRLKAGAGAETR